jgi:predicted permease
MTLLARLRSFFRALTGASHLDAEMDQELRFHVEARTDDLAARGISRDEAAAQARREMGDILRWKEQGRDARGVRLVDDVRADVRYGLRQLRRSPGFAMAASASLALGIGANVAIFTLANTILLKSLPVARPAELVQVAHAGQRGQSTSSNYQWFDRLRKRGDVFSGLFAVRMQEFTADANDSVDRVIGQQIAGDYFGTLGIRPALGRTWAPDEPGADRLAVISDSYWRRRFAADPNVVGRAIELDGSPFVIAGVTPPGFFGLQVGRMMDVTVALDVRDYDEPDSWTSVAVIGRLKTGLEAGAAERTLDPVLARLAADRRLSDRARQQLFERVELPSVRNGLSALRDEFEDPLRILFGVVAILLALACVNLAGLLIARNASRERELRTRLALGAGRGRVARQLITESALLALAGTAVGLGAGWASSRGLVAMLPDRGWPRTLPTGVDGFVLAFATAIAAATVLLFGVWPAYRAARADVGLMGREARDVRVKSGIGRALVAVQIALGVVLIAGALLFVRTLRNFSQLDAGFSRDGVVLASLALGDRIDAGERLRIHHAVLERLRSVPQITQATLGSMTPLSGNEQGRPISVPGSKAPLDEDRHLPPPLGAPGSVAQVNAIASEYFETFGIAIVQGRGISDRDIAGAPRAAVVSESFARRHFGNAIAIGRRFSILGAAPAEYEIVGVARDVRYRALRQDAPPPLVYVSQWQVPEHDVDVAIRTTDDERQARMLVQQVIRSVAPSARYVDVTSVSGRIAESLWRERLLAALCTFFAAVAIVLASIGTYALLAHLVARRRFELGLRTALGAKASAIVWLVVRQGLALAVGGGAVGIAIARLTLGGLEGLLFGLAPTDRATLLLSGTVLVIVALIATLVPARRAAAIDPLIALRSE